MDIETALLYLQTSYDRYEVVMEESRNMVSALRPTIHLAWQFTHDQDGAWYRSGTIIFHRPSFKGDTEERCWRVRLIATPMKKGGEDVK